ncbi:50S ribosomal protein L11 methyltransferase [Alicyclobacillus hesperidum URH17-3-68]|uniref:Ribosomal protein L11 methyltransferase n=1 Tax=Alicyclobacillus hesperidum TaxID=89784 RepID=A0A1H2U9F8_9BACL|nr:50S ribosomal protein L11 methyltransferase [Alicyclobacillus hesperidum]EJY57045.1 50S ribosomal protein L11 methyltransferase [Alicyclobacillus hesperidum URH17-3-68]GLV14138.1 ribosomal protein L11 methyltransferase [Alicyclobacillus hesperidum]SDW52832.1 [LSU ribosomal protein L11P]-lysine N-methyltransferase [Alicyclobacillus hesperidum]
MHWWHVQFRVAHEASDAIAALLQEFPDVQGVQLEGIGEFEQPHPEYGEWFDEMIVPTPDVAVAVYFPDEYDPAELRDRIQGVIDRVAAAGVHVGDGPIDIRIDAIDDSVWLNAWKEHYAPIPVGDSLVIVPIWHVDQLTGDLALRERIVIEPGMAFGTGAHQTTQMCAAALAEIVTPEARVLDVGTGTGVLAIAAARLGAQRVTAIDIDPVAVRAARENVARNELADRIQVSEGNLLTGFAEGVQFDIAIANILRDIVILLVPQVASRMPAGGRFLTSGYIDTQAPAVEAALRKSGFTIEKRYQRDDWVALLAVKV